MVEAKRRTAVKALGWRLIGVIWTWIGAYLILLFTPDRYRSAALLSTFIVVYHHSTRMVMYYGYERVWDKVTWARSAPGGPSNPPLSWRAILAWVAITLLALVLIFVLILYVAPLLKP